MNRQNGDTKFRKKALNSEFKQFSVDIRTNFFQKNKFEFYKL